MRLYRGPNIFSLGVFWDPAKPNPNPQLEGPHAWGVEVLGSAKLLWKVLDFLAAKALPTKKPKDSGWGQGQAYIFQAPNWGSLFNNDSQGRETVERGS